MFQNCKSLTSINLSNFIVNKAETMQGMFCGCSSLKSLDLSSFSAENLNNVGEMFKDCISLENVYFSPNLKINGVNYAYSMFQNCQSLKSLDLSNFDTSNTRTFAFMFSNCNSLTSLNIMNFKTSMAYTIENMFYQCYSLTSLYLPYFETTSISESMKDVFEGCNKLTLSIKKDECYNLIEYIPDYVEIIYL